jgi:hypothetical protein
MTSLMRPHVELITEGVNIPKLAPIALVTYSWLITRVSSDRALIQ